MKRVGKLLLTALMVVSVVQSPNFTEANANILKNSQIHSERGFLEYEGSLKNGKPEGIGKTYSQSNDVSYVGFEGSFKDGKRDGFGIEYDLKNGKKVASYYGTYKNNKEDGYGATFYRGELEYIGEYKNGKRDGLGSVYHAGGFIEEVWTDSGTPLSIITKDRSKVINSPPTYFTETLVKATLAKTGTAIQEKIVESELKLRIEEYVNAKKDIFDFFSKLKYTTEENYVKVYNLDGDLIYAGESKDNRPEGYGISFKNKKATYIGQFKNGVRDGLGVDFDVYTGRREGEVVRRRDMISGGITLSERITTKHEDIRTQMPFQVMRIPYETQPSRSYLMGDTNESGFIERELKGIIDNYNRDLKNIDKYVDDKIEDIQRKRKLAPPTV